MQSILKAKPELLHYAVLKKAMDIEEFLYSDALVRTRLDRNDGHVWQSRDSIREYQISADRLMRRLRERDGDWVKLFSIQDIRVFIYQVYQGYVPGKVSPAYCAAQPCSPSCGAAESREARFHRRSENCQKWKESHGKENQRRPVGKPSLLCVGTCALYGLTGLYPHRKRRAKRSSARPSHWMCHGCLWPICHRGPQQRLLRPPSWRRRRAPARRGRGRRWA